MSHHINGYVGPISELERLTAGMKHARIARLVQGLGFLPYTHQLSDEIKGRWFKLGNNAQAPIVHVETDYFGGAGDQSAAYWKDGKKAFRAKGSGSPIDRALKMLGVVCADGQDEFDTIGLGRYRDNESWAKIGIAKGEPCCSCCGVPKRLYDEQGHDKECSFYEDEMYRIAREWVCKYDPDKTLGDWRDRYDLAVEFLLDQTKHLKQTIAELRGVSEPAKQEACAGADTPTGA